MSPTTEAAFEAVVEAHPLQHGYVHVSNDYLTAVAPSSLVFVELRDVVDAETGRYTVKRYESERAGHGDAWQHTKITLKPTNPEFEPIVLTDVDEGAVQVVAELLEVVSP